MIYLNVEKIRGWKEGILTKTLTSVGGSALQKGEKVRYRRYKTVKDSEGFRSTEYEWHYLNLENRNLIRTTELTIDGEEYRREPRL